MTQPVVQECVYPDCTVDDQPTLTTQVMCDRSRRHYRRELDWIVIDYVTLKSGMPSPARRGTQVRASNLKSFGHPAEWSSDQAALIADVLNETEDDLRDHLRHEPPPHPRVEEAHRVEHAYRYLVDRFDDLCVYPGAEGAALVIHERHQRIRSLLGLTRFVQWLPTPCPNCTTPALTRNQDQITCGDCGFVIKEANYAFMARVLLDTLLDDYDTLKSSKLAGRM